MSPTETAALIKILKRERIIGVGPEDILRLQATLAAEVILDAIEQMAPGDLLTAMEGLGTLVEDMQTNLVRRYGG